MLIDEFYVEEEKKEGTIFVIRPSRKVEVGRIEKNKEKLMELYQEGYEDAAAVWEELSRFLDLTDETKK